ncbi:HAD family hydrolase [Candidatus Thorarchaeota archaeon]|nr:MAG: HAD family hydrolase [Candidatus Thorarchaeota archaeon]
MVSILVKVVELRRLEVLMSLNIDEFQAVVFDLDSTLVDTHRYPMVASEWLMRHSNVDVEKDGMSYVQNLVTRYFKSIEETVSGAPFVTPFEIIRTAMAMSLEDHGYNADPSLVEQATQRFRSLHIELSTPYPGVPELLSYLDTRGLKLGVLTNSFQGDADIILTNWNLRQYFKAIVDCGLVRAFKPMPEPFEGIISVLDVTPSETLYVGDEYYADMVGGKGVGFTTVWINHRDHSLEDLISKYGPENAPDYVTQSITEFAEML